MRRPHSEKHQIIDRRPQRSKLFLQMNEWLNSLQVHLLRMSRRTLVFTEARHTDSQHYGTHCGIQPPCTQVRSGWKLVFKIMKLFPSADVCSFWIGRPAEAWNGPALGSGDRSISLRQKKHLFQTLFDLSWLFRTAWSRWTGHRSRLPRGWQCWGLRRLVWSATGTSWFRLG